MIFALSSTISARALDAKIKENESNETTTTVKRDDMDDFIFEEATTKSQNPDYDQIAAVSVEEGKSKLPEADQIAAVSVEEEKNQLREADQIAAVSVEEGKSKLREADQIAAVSVEEGKNIIRDADQIVAVSIHLVNEAPNVNTEDAKEEVDAVDDLISETTSTNSQLLDPEQTAPVSFEEPQNQLPDPEQTSPVTFEKGSKQANENTEAVKEGENAGEENDDENEKYQLSLSSNFIVDLPNMIVSTYPYLMISYPLYTHRFVLENPGFHKVYVYSMKELSKQEALDALITANQLYEKQMKEAALTYAQAMKEKDEALKEAAISLAQAQKDKEEALKGAAISLAQAQKDIVKGFANFLFDSNLNFNIKRKNLLKKEDSSIVDQN